MSVVFEGSVIILLENEDSIIKVEASNEGVEIVLKEFNNSIKFIDQRQSTIEAAMQLDSKSLLLKAINQSASIIILDLDERHIEIILSESYQKPTQSCVFLTNPTNRVPYSNEYTLVKKTSKAFVFMGVLELESGLNTRNKFNREEKLQVKALPFVV